MSNIEIVAGLDPAEIAARGRFVEQEFGEDWDPADGDLERAILPLSRFLTARIGAEVAGSTFSFGLPLHLPGPGRTAPCAAVSGVAVRADLRRRGVLTALMERQLAEARERGESLACLWASEGAIYGRFGYGMAAAQLAVNLPRSARLQRAPRYSGPLSLVAPGDALPGLARAHEAAARPGFLVRDEALWALRTHDPERRRKGGAPLRCLVAGDPADPDGYALYSVTGAWSTSGPQGRVHIREVLAQDPSARAALWTWLTDVDLTSVVQAEHLPVDDPVLALLANPRAAGATWSDGLHVRLIDLPAALCGRDWAAPLDLVLDVTDSSCPWNAGRWHLTCGPEGASCVRTPAEADLGCDVADLGAAHLGGTSVAQLAAAGRVLEFSPGAVRALTRAARGELAPCSPLVF